MTMWVPPLWARRVLHVLSLPMVVLLTAVLLPFYVIGAVIAIFPGRRRLLRVVSFAMAYLWTDLGMLLGCWALWFVQPLPGRDVTLWRERHRPLVILGRHAGPGD